MARVRARWNRKQARGNRSIRNARGQAAFLRRGRALGCHGRWLREHKPRGWCYCLVCIPVPGTEALPPWAITGVDLACCAPSVSCSGTPREAEWSPPFQPLQPVTRRWGVCIAALCRAAPAPVFAVRLTPEGRQCAPLAHRGEVYYVLHVTHAITPTPRLAAA